MIKYPDPPDHGDEEPELPPVEMSDKETAATIREWCSKPRSPWEWPTDPCGYVQHIRFVLHRNANLKTGEDYNAFLLAYADTLDPPESK